VRKEQSPEVKKGKVTVHQESQFSWLDEEWPAAGRTEGREKVGIDVGSH